MNSFIAKLLRAPRSNETKLIDVVQMWEVRCKSRCGEYSDNVRPELECFPSREQADEFAQSIKNAFALLRTTGNGTEVSVAAGKASK